MAIFGSIETSASGLTAERLRMDLISENVANANTTRTDNGEPYRRQFPIFMEREGTQVPPFAGGTSGGGEGKGVRVLAIGNDPSPFKKVHDPSHPDADEKGYVSLPNVNVIREMVDLITASRAYEANITVLNSAKGMMTKAIEIGRG